MTIAAALAAARAAGLPSLDAQLLLARVVGLSRTGLIAHDDRALSTVEAARWSDWLQRRADGEPLAYLVGEKEFHGLVFEVDPDVLVPRPETELLVDWAATLIAATSEGPASFVDLGTGSGAVAVTLKHLHPDASVTASDCSGPALAVARRNAARHGCEIEFVEGSWWQPLAGRCFQVAVANPPYIAAGDPHLAALRHEPTVALTPGGDGLSAIAAIVTGAHDALLPGGWLLVEHGFDQADTVTRLFRAAGMTRIETQVDLAGQARVTGGRRHSPP